MDVPHILQSQPKAFLIAETLLLLAIVGILDSISGWDISLFLFYAAPIVFAAWFGNRHLAILCSLACGAMWHWANVESHPYGTVFAYTWATFNRTIYFLFVALGTTAMRRQREEFHARMDALLRARELEQEIVRVSEREQMRIGQDLHDGLCQSLVAIDCAAACLKSDLEGKGATEATEVGAIQKMLREAAMEARDLARGIFPVQMDANGLPAALDELVSKMNRPGDLSVTFGVAGDVAILDPQASMHVYRIAQQALSNALAHGGASHIAIRLMGEGARLKLTVTDDGCGFDTAGQSLHGMGLRTMRYRARLIDATLSIDSTPGGGTKIICQLTHPPVPND